MDRNLAGKKCPHGMCLNHSPEWENVGEKRREPNPTSITRAKTYRFGILPGICCDSRMARYKEVYTQRCKKCGRTQDLVTMSSLALCLCCGRHFNAGPMPSILW